MFFANVQLFQDLYSCFSCQNIAKPPDDSIPVQDSIQNHQIIFFTMNISEK